MASAALDPAVALLRDLVRIDSVNPALVPGGRGEAEIASFIARHLASLGLQVDVADALPGRPNVVGVLRGAAPGAALMFCGHTDTVGTTGMDRPFAAELRDGRLYGRGAQDMKGGLAAMIDAVRMVIERGGLGSGSLIVAAVADEEHGSAGAEALVRRWSADAAVVTEPTSLDVAVAHKGFQWVDVQTRGRAAHGSRPKEGRDAILMMGRVLARLEALDRRLQHQAPHPLLGTPSLHASIVEGGHELSSYPVQARLQFERRTLPGEAATAAVDEALAILDELRREDPGFEAEAALMFGRDGYAIDAANPLPEALARAARRVGASARPVGMTFWTDAAILGGAGIPSVIFGPGGAGLHGIEEYVVVDDVLRCRDALAELAVAFTAQAGRDRAAAGGAGV